MSNEIELKLRISPADAARLRQHPLILSHLREPPVTRKLNSIYYDTPDLALLDAGISLRVRRMAGGWFQAVKAAGHSSAGLHQRMEWEDIIAAGHPDFSKITEPALTRIFDQPSLRQELAPIFTTDVRRTEWHLVWDNGDHVELALDIGHLVVGAAREPIREIELELKAGETRRLFELALALQNDLRLELENVSKAQRGYAHYRPQAPVVVRAHHTVLKKHMPASTAFRQIAWECLGQWQGNHDMVLSGDDPEGVHQMRVALRRLRSAIGTFDDILGQDEVAGLREELRWITEVLGKARDLDVFISETLPPMVLHLQAHPGLLTLREKARKSQASAYAEVRSALGTQRYHRLLLLLGAWLEGLPSPDNMHGPEVHSLAERMLAKRYRQLCRHGQRLDDMHAEERHAARIAAKKLRYAAEFFSSLYPAKETRAFLRKLAALQNVLGDLNDVTVTDHLVRTLCGARPTRDTDEARHLFMGWSASRAHHQLEQMRRTWKAFAVTPVFWR